MKKEKLKRELRLKEAQRAFGTRLFISEGAELIIENHRGILEYGRENILISGRGGSIGIKGGNLLAKAMNRDRIVITGKIQEISFGGGNGF